jgi:cell division transport system permease protein
LFLSFSVFKYSMLLVSIYRLIKFAIQNFFRNFWLSLVTITIIVLSLFSVNTLISLEAISQAILNSVADKIDIAIYLKPDTPQESVLLTLQEIKNLSDTKEASLTSAKDALEIFKQKHATDPLINEALAELDENPLGPIISVQAHDISSYDNILEQINSLGIEESIEDIEFADRQILINKLNDITDKTRIALAIISAVFILISILVVFNTIRLGIYAHREEIGIMKLVGASNSFTRLPFIFEGFLYALFGLVIFWVLMFLLLSWLNPILNGFLSEIDFSVQNFFQSNFFTFFWQQLLALTVINSISAAIAIRKYLKV